MSGRVGLGRVGSDQEIFEHFTGRVGSPLPGPTRPDPRGLTRSVNSPDNLRSSAYLDLAGAFVARVVFYIDKQNR